MVETGILSMNPRTATIFTAGYGGQLNWQERGQVLLFKDSAG